MPNSSQICGAKKLPIITLQPILAFYTIPNSDGMTQRFDPESFETNADLLLSEKKYTNSQHEEGCFVVIVDLCKQAERHCMQFPMVSWSVFFKKNIQLFIIIKLKDQREDFLDTSLSGEDLGMMNFFQSFPPKT